MSEDSEARSFDPLRKTRDKFIEMKDETDAAVLKDSWVDIRHGQAKIISFAVERTVGKFSKEGGILRELMERLDDEKTLTQILGNIETAYSSDDFGKSGFAEWLTNDSRAQSIEVAEVYLDVVKGVTREMVKREEEGKLTVEESVANPIIPGSSNRMAEDFRNGRLKDRLSVLTPKKYRYSENFDRGVKAVNDALGLPSELTRFEDIKYPEL